MKKITLPIKKATRNVRDALAAVGLKVFAQDAEPEEIMDAVEALAEEKNQSNDEETTPNTPSQESDPKQTGDDAKDPTIAALEAKMDQIMEKIGKLENNGGNKDAAPEDPIDAAIAELEGQQSDDDNDEEESHTIPAESMDESGPVTDPEDRPQEVLSTDRAAMIRALKAIKPMLAEIQDPAAKKRAADAAIKEIVGTPTKKTYGKMNKRQKSAKDQKTNTQSHPQDNSQLGQDWAKQFNPHYKDRA